MDNDHHREYRLQIMLDEKELEAIDEWRFNHRMSSRSDAFRELLKRGLIGIEPSDQIH